MGRDLEVFAHPLAWVRWQRDWSQRDLINRLARRLGIPPDRKQPSRWEARGVTPREDVQRALAAELEIDVAQLKARPWPQWLIPRGDDLALRAPWTVEGLQSVLDHTAEGAPMDRRGFLVLLTDAAAASLVGTWARTPAPAPLPAAGDGAGGMGADLLGSMEDRLALLRARDDVVGGGRTWQLVENELRGARALLRTGEFTGALRTRLLALIGEQARVAGWSCVDAGRLAAGEVYLVQALRAAHAAGDAAAGANVIKSLSLVVLEDGRPWEALEMVQWARAVTRTAPARVRAMLAVREARIRATMRDTASHTRIVNEAAALMTQADREAPEELPVWARYFDAAEFAAQVAAGHLAARQLDPAQHHLDHALQAQPGERRRDAVTYGLWGAEIAARRGDADQAVDRLGDLLPDVGSSNSGRNRAHVARVQALLKQGGFAALPQVRGLDEQVRTLLA
ncbi:transcriptional regulator with XRE-family HTH domain [Streptacidiphilus sp. BW17]|uniref:helix-turn-helix domain-containing protein n=1 Tax=Streptacidiphilus sp. BW17 TaxID=3156274 RepID=UPI003518A65B